MDYKGVGNLYAVGYSWLCVYSDMHNNGAMRKLLTALASTGK